LGGGSSTACELKLLLGTDSGITLDDNTLEPGKRISASIGRF